VSAAAYGTSFASSDMLSKTLKISLFDGQGPLSWSRAGVTADFVADLLFGISERHGRVADGNRHSISFVANEFIENAIKFRSGGDVIIEASVEEDIFQLAVTNISSPTSRSKLSQLVSKIGKENPEKLLLEQLEAAATSTDLNASGLGILTVMADYKAEVVWVVDESAQEDDGPVRVRVALPLS
jgi:hypothetical protein